MFEFSVSKDMKRERESTKQNNDKRRVSTYLLASFLTLFVK